MEESNSVKKYALIIAMAASFLTPFVGSAINLAVPSIGREFNAATFLLSWTVTGYLLSSSAFLLPFGRLADIIGRKKIFISGLVVFFLSSVLCGFSWSVEALIAFRVLQGIGSSMIFGTSMAILTSVFPIQERGKILGLNTAVVYVGLSLGPVLGGWMTHIMGWNSIFYFASIVSVFALFLTLTKMKGEWYGAKGEKFDINGSILYSTGLIFFMYGISSVSSSAWAVYFALAGITLIIYFVFYERKLEQPILDTTLFSKNITFVFSNFAALINYSATFAVGFLLSLHLQVVMGFNSQAAGQILLIQPVIMAVFSPFFGRLSDRVQPRIVSSWGMAVTALGLLIFCWINQEMSIWLIVFNLVLLGTGFALFSSPNTNAVMSSVERKYYGVASSTLGTMRLTGQAISMAVVTLIIAFFVGNVELSPAYSTLLVKSSRTAFVVFTILCVVGVFASLARGDLSSEVE